MKFDKSNFSSEKQLLNIKEKSVVIDVLKFDKLNEVNLKQLLNKYFIELFTFENFKLDKSIYSKELQSLNIYE